MINKYLILIIIIITLFISGCNDGVIYIESESSGDCVIKCKNLTKQFNYHCMEASASFQQEIKNNNILNNTCECILFDCFKKIK